MNEEEEVRKKKKMVGSYSREEVCHEAQDDGRGKDDAQLEEPEDGDDGLNHQPRVPDVPGLGWFHKDGGGGGGHGAGDHVGRLHVGHHGGPDQRVEPQSC